MVALCDYCNLPVTDAELRRGSCISCGRPLAGPIGSGEALRQGIASSPGVMRLEIDEPEPLDDAFRPSRFPAEQERVRADSDDLPVPDISFRGQPGPALERYRGVGGWLL